MSEKEINATGEENSLEVTQNSGQLSDEQLEDASGGGGGGIYNSGTLTITDSTISGNQTSRSSANIDELSTGTTRD